MTRITDFGQLTSPAGNDVLLAVDVSDTSQNAAGTTKQVAISALPFDASGAAAAVAAGLATETNRAEAAEGQRAQLGTDGHISPSVLPRPVLYNPQGLRRWRAALGDALFSKVPIVCVGDSITAGQGGDNNLLTFSNVPDNTNAWVGQLRSLLGISTGTSAGEGFIFSDDSRVTQGGGVFSNNWACTPLRHGPRLLHGSGFTLAITIPSGVTALGVIQANQTQAFSSAGSNLADVSALYSQTGSATVNNASITTLTNTGRAIETDITCQAGDVITISSPATAQSYIVGFVLKTAASGVMVHRVGQAGYVSGDLLGGQLSGTLIQSASSTNQVNAARAIYDWAGTTGLIVVSFGTNDQFNQAGAGTAAQNDVVLSLYTAWMSQFMTQAVSDGWCCLVLGEPRNPNALTSGATEDQYWGAMKSFALATDHVSFIDTGELWGSNAAATALGLGASNTVHPNRRGHGDIARMLHRVLSSNTAGITELVVA
jgi:lysophospholipase L1-like esterase